MPERIASHLTWELDAITPARPLPAQARYHTPARAARVGGFALAGAAAAVLVTVIGAVATMTTGSPNPQVWTVQLAGGLHQLGNPVAEPARPTSLPPTPPGSSSRAVPVPAASDDGRGGAPDEQPTGKPEPKRSPDPRRGRPSADPSESPPPSPDVKRR